jgi:8-oxo-dGTP diphosphatase
MKDAKVGLGVIVYNPLNEKVLVLKRKGSHGAGTWSFPGGHLEYKETWKHCAKRELIEETGLEVSKLKFLTATNDIFLEEDKHYVTIYLVAKYEGGVPEIKEPEKCESLEWFYIDKLPNNLFLCIRNLLKQPNIVDKIKNSFKKEIILINSVSSKILNLPKWLRKFFIKVEYNQGMIYLDNEGNPSKEMTDKVRWLEEVKVIGKSNKDIIDTTYKYFNKKYPELKGFIYLF